jgi:hypothetical protein
MPFLVSDFQAVDREWYLQNFISNQRIIKWHKPCRNSRSYSECQEKEIDLTYNSYCFRGPDFPLEKSPNEKRIVVVGGSTVESSNGDGDTWVFHLQKKIKETFPQRNIRVINAGHASYSSEDIRKKLLPKILTFQPDIVMYYEAWNEQNPKRHFFLWQEKLFSLTSGFHKFLYESSAFYIYILEKYLTLTTQENRLWVIDINKLRKNLEYILREVTRFEAKFIFITQVSKPARYFVEVDTHNTFSIKNKIEKLKKDQNYQYNAYEISALNQRLAVAESITFLRRIGSDIIDLRDEYYNYMKEAELFNDLAHMNCRGEVTLGNLVFKYLSDIQGIF